MPTKRAKPEPSSAEAAGAKSALLTRPGFLIRRMHQIHLALFAEECAGFDITPVQYSIMTVAAEQPKLDQSGLCQEVGVDRATLANVIARLEAKGYIERTENARDKRVKLISITPAGTLLLDKVRKHAKRAHERTIAALPPAERDILIDLLIRLVDAQNDYGRAPLRLS